MLVFASWWIYLPSWLQKRAVGMPYLPPCMWECFKLRTSTERSTVSMRHVAGHGKPQRREVSESGVGNEFWPSHKPPGQKVWISAWKCELGIAKKNWGMSRTSHRAKNRSERTSLTTFFQRQPFFGHSVGDETQLYENYKSRESGYVPRHFCRLYRGTAWAANCWGAG
jgi:hypothetical protein